MKNKLDRLGEFEELVLLAVGQLGAHATSVAIQETLMDRADRDAALGAIYAALDRLERKKCVNSHLAEPTAKRGGRRKRHYALTKTGLEAVADARRIREAMWQRLNAKVAP